MSVNKLTAGTITSKSILLAVNGGDGDTEIRAGIATGDFNNSGAASGFILGLDDSDSDKPKFYFGAGTKYIKFDGTDLIHGPDTKILGASAYNNDTTIYRDVRLKDVDDIYDMSSGGAITEGIYALTISSADSNGAYGIAAYGDGYNTNDYTWDANRRFKTKAYFTGSLSSPDIFIGMGEASATMAARRIGFKVTYVASAAKLYGAVHDGTSETTVDLGITVIATDNLKLEAVRSASNRVDFYVNGVNSGNITTGIPSGTISASWLYHVFVKCISNNLATSVTVSGFRFLQE